MLFNSYEFLFIFLPIVLSGFFVLARFSHRMSAVWLALASLFFYGWWSPKYVLLLLFSVVVNYCAGYVIGNAASRARAKYLLIFFVAFDLILLGFYKYANFFIDTANWISGDGWPLMNVILPLGISFFTFTQIAFLVDVYRSKAREYNFSHYLLFVTYFPHLIAGPVLHHEQMMPQFSRKETYRFQWDLIAMGATIFTIGLIKKMLLADSFSIYSGPVFAAVAHGVQPDFIEAWTGSLAYTFQLYFDFSGYSDMAIGLSLLFGIRLPINFNSPYKAANIIEFWRRWHMTLSQFLRDYLYIPLGGNQNGKIRRHVNLMITMLLGGLWHGANWTFVIWGGLHGIFLVVNHVWRGQVTRHLPAHGRFSCVYRYAAVLLTFLCVVIAWIFFRADSFSAAMNVLGGCFGHGGISLPSKLGGVVPHLGGLRSWIPETVSYGGVFLNIPALGSVGGIAPFLRLLAVALLIVWCLPNSQQFLGLVEGGRAKGRIFGSLFVWKPSRMTAFVFGCVLCFALSKLDKVSAFLYYQF